MAIAGNTMVILLVNVQLYYIINYKIIMVSRESYIEHVLIPAGCDGGL